MSVGLSVMVISLQAPRNSLTSHWLCGTRTHVVVIHITFCNSRRITKHNNNNGITIIMPRNALQNWISKLLCYCYAIKHWCYPKWTVFYDKIISLTIRRLLVNFLSNSLTSPGFPEKWSSWLGGLLKTWWINFQTSANNTAAKYTFNENF